MERRKMERQACPSDLNDAEWDIMQDYIRAVLPGGRPTTDRRREIVNAILYGLRTGCGWEYRPHEFGCWKTGYDYVRQWRRRRGWQKANDALREREPRRVNPHREP